MKTFPVGWVGGEWVGGEKLELKLNSAQLGLEAWAELGNRSSSAMRKKKIFLDPF